MRSPPDVYFASRHGRSPSLDIETESNGERVLITQILMYPPTPKQHQAFLAAHLIGIKRRRCLTFVSLRPLGMIRKPCRRAVAAVRLVIALGLRMS